MKERSPALVERPERLLVVAAHPGDADAAVAGSVARWVGEGSVAQLVCCTSGDGSSDDADADPLDLAAAREAEQRAAARIVGYEAVTFLHRPEGALANDLATREQLVRVVRAFRPDTVVAPDPRRIVDARGVAHTDVRAAGAAALDAVSPAAANAMAFPHLLRSEGLAPHRVGRLYLYWPESQAERVDIASSVEVKRSALRAHRHLDAESELGEATESFTVIDHI